VNTRVAAMLTALLLLSAACAGTDSAGTAPDITGLTAARVGTSDTSGFSAVTKPPEQVQASSPAGSGPGLSGKAFLWDDYRNYRSTSDFQLMISRNLGGRGDPHTSIYNDGVNAGMAALDDTILYNGHPTVKYNQPGGTSATPELWVSFPQPLTRFWFRAKVRFSQGFTTDGVTPNYGKGYKLFGWGWRGNNGRGSIELGNVSQYYIVWGVTPDGSNTAYGSAPDVTAMRPASAEWQTGLTAQTRQNDNWYDYIVLYEQTSSTSVRERWWLARDGEQPVLQGDNVGHMTTGQVPAADRFMMGMNFNQQRAQNQNQALWYGQWELVNGEQHANPFGLPGI
jgi:hypothetical protein